jgi:hypothetical protein
LLTTVNYSSILFSVMFDRSNAKSTFLTALRRLSGDPYQMAKILRIGAVAPDISPSAPHKSRESLQLDDVDWSAVLNSWIDANLAADAVRTVALARSGQAVAWIRQTNESVCITSQ